MIHFLRSVQSESIKYKSKSALLFLLMPLFLIVLIWLLMKNIIVADPSRATWSLFMQTACATWAVFLFSPFVIFWATHTMALERHNWKLLFIQGRPKYQLLFSKITVLLVFLSIQMTVFLLSTWCLGQTLDLQDSFPISRSLLIFQAVAVTWPIIAAQMFLATWFRGYLPLIIPALIGHFASLIGVQFTIGRYLPWSFVLEFLQIRGSDAQTDPTYFAIGLLFGLALTLATIARLKKLSS